MVQDYSKNLIYGNFLGMENSAFPIDCETLATVQSNAKKFAATALIAGCERLILTGCQQSGTVRKEGYVFIVNPDNPLTGEVLFHPEQPAKDHCHVKESPVDVTADGTDYPAAYTERSLEEGLVEGAWLWSSFTRIEDISNAALKDSLNTVNNALDQKIESLKNNAQYTFVRGMILMWSGKGEKTIPDGWALCDGQTYQIDGEMVKTPDLRDKFVMGAKYEPSGSPELGTFLNVGTTGGEASVTLTVEQMPTHSHTGTTGSGLTSLPDLHKPKNTTGFPDGSSDEGNGSNNENGRQAYWRGKGDIARFSHTHNLTTANAGGGQAHENRPPFYVLAYIMKL